MGIKEAEEVQVKGIHNVVNKIIAEKFPNLKKVCPFRYREPPGHQTDLTKVCLIISPCHIIIKTTSTENREKILKAVREKKQITCKSKPIKITADFSMETLKARRA
jgi:hypothetical protein